MEKPNSTLFDERSGYKRLHWITEAGATEASPSWHVSGLLEIFNLRGKEDAKMEQTS